MLLVASMWQAMLENNLDARSFAAHNIQKRGILPNIKTLGPQRRLLGSSLRRPQNLQRPRPWRFGGASFKPSLFIVPLLVLLDKKRRVSQPRHAICNCNHGCRDGCRSITVKPIKQFIISCIRGWATVILVEYSTGPLHGTRETVHV